MRHKSELYVESHWQGSLMIDLVSDVIDEGTRNESSRKGVPDGIKAILRLGQKRMKPTNEGYLGGMTHIGCTWVVELH